jgi:hypothetical protein
MNVSNTPWSSFSQADYDDEQWQRATILDHETGNTPKEPYGLTRLGRPLFPIVGFVRRVGVSLPGEWTADVVEDRL